MDPREDVGEKLASSAEINEKLENAARLRREADEIRPNTRILAGIAESIANDQEQEARDLAIGSLVRREQELELMIVELDRYNQEQEEDQKGAGIGFLKFFIDKDKPSDLFDAIKGLTSQDELMSKSYVKTQVLRQEGDGGKYKDLDYIQKLPQDDRRSSLYNFDHSDRTDVFSVYPKNDLLRAKPQETIGNDAAFPKHASEKPMGMGFVFDERGEPVVNRDIDRYSFLRRAIEGMVPDEPGHLDLGGRSPVDPLDQRQ